MNVSGHPICCSEQFLVQPRVSCVLHVVNILTTTPIADANRSKIRSVKGPTDTAQSSRRIRPAAQVTGDPRTERKRNEPRAATARHKLLSPWQPMPYISSCAAYQPIPLALTTLSRALHATLTRTKHQHVPVSTSSTF